MNAAHLPLLFLFACDGDAPVAPTKAAATGELLFVRGGLVLPNAEGAQQLSGGRSLIFRDWQPGEEVSAGGLRGVAPQMPECATLFHVRLGDVSRLIAMGGSAPDTALSWSPTADRLAIGSYTGDVVVVDGWSGRILARRHLAEAMVKRVAWSPDGAVLYAAEQSPDALLHAMNPATLADNWALRLADQVDSSAPPAGDDVYGIYALPSAYGLEILNNGDLLVAAAHGWNDGDGVRHNKSRLLRLRPSATGAQTVAAYPTEVADAIFVNLSVDEDAGQVALSINRSSEGPPAADLPVGGVVVLDLADLSEADRALPEPLPPYFTSTFLWEAVDLDGGELMLGLGDGRVLRQRASETLRTLTPGTPVLAGDVPIAASVGHGFLHEGDAIFLTSNTNIPWGAASPDLRPPTAHPGENTLWVYGPADALRWTWRGPQRLTGVSLGEAGRTLVVGAGERVADERQDLFGALLFDLSGDPRSGAERLISFCATEGPVFYRMALSDDGRLALSEHPWRDQTGQVTGSYQVTVTR